MKEIESRLIDATEVAAVKPIRKQVKYLGTLRPQPGQKIWELDLSTRRIKEVVAEAPAEVDFNSASKGDYSTHRKLDAKENCLYVCAINAQNADKKFFKMLGLKHPGTKIKPDNK